MERKTLVRACVVIALLLLFAGIWFSGILIESGFGRDVSGTPSDLAVYCFDVGQGDATLIRTPSGDVLIDTGADASETRLCALLEALDVKRIAALILTHPDSDHVGGTDGVLRRFRVEQICLPDGDVMLEEDASMRKLLSCIDESGVPVTRVRAGSHLVLGDMTVQFLAPVSRFYGETNRYSIVSRVVYGDTSFLFPGDADESVEAELCLAYGTALESTVLHVGHHGASSSTSETFLRAVSPEIAVISVGAENTYGHPAGQTLDRLEQNGVTVYRTDTEGTLILKTDGKTVRRGTWLN